jgi:hypothetical protein
MKRKFSLWVAWLLSGLFNIICVGCGVVFGDTYLIRLMFSCVWFFWFWISGYTFHKYMISEVKHG